MQLETALRLPALAMQLSKLVKTLVSRVTEGAEAHREHDSDDQCPAVAYIISMGSGCPAGIVGITDFTTYAHNARAEPCCLAPGGSRSGAGEGSDALSGRGGKHEL